MLHPTQELHNENSPTVLKCSSEKNTDVCLTDQDRHARNSQQHTSGAELLACNSSFFP